MFKVGQKVVCVKGFVKKFNETIPIKGEIYTVREIVKVRNWCTRLVEIVNDKHDYWQNGLLDECAFNVIAFRPVDTTFGEQVCESLEVMTEPELV